jgi:methylenetetrahydrofolate reductase (NADPH)
MSATVAGSRDEQITALLDEPRYELMPFESFDEQLTHLPDGAKITITASPSKDIEATIDCAERAARKGYEAIPHIAARYVRDAAQLEEIAQRLVEVGIDDIFVPGGDRDEPIGDFDSAYALLTALEELEYEFDDIGITGYPEGHPKLSPETLAQSMEQKQPYATYITTQLCYDPETIIGWIEGIRDRGVTLPVSIGIPGVMNYQRLLSISQRVGVGDSLQFLHKTTGILDFVRQMIGSRGTYTPDRLIDGVATYSNDPEYGIQDVHIYTFNEAEATEDWRRKSILSQA